MEGGTGKQLLEHPQRSTGDIKITVIGKRARGLPCHEVTFNQKKGENKITQKTVVAFSGQERKKGARIKKGGEKSSLQREDES